LRKENLNSDGQTFPPISRGINHPNPNHILVKGDKIPPISLLKHMTS